MNDWTGLEEALVAGREARAVLPDGYVGNLDQALASWRDRLDELGISVHDERALFIFCAGVDTMARAMRSMTPQLEPVIHDCWRSAFGTLMPYIDEVIAP